MIQSKCCKAPIKNVSCEEGTGFMLCSKCACACDMENEDKTTAVKVLSEITGIPEYRISNPDLGEYITKTGALLAMEEYSNQRSTGFIKEIEELKEENKRLNKVMPIAIYDKLKQQNESLSQTIEGLTKALKDIKNWDDDLEDEWEDQGYRAIDALNKYNQSKQQ